jgi:hypothetical protein
LVLLWCFLLYAALALLCFGAVFGATVFGAAVLRRTLMPKSFTPHADISCSLVPLLMAQHNKTQATRDAPTSNLPQEGAAPHVTPAATVAAAAAACCCSCLLVPLLVVQHNTTHAPHLDAKVLHATC